MNSILSWHLINMAPSNRCEASSRCGRAGLSPAGMAADRRKIKRRWWALARRAIFIPARRPRIWQQQPRVGLGGGGSGGPGPGPAPRAQSSKKLRPRELENKDSFFSTKNHRRRRLGGGEAAQWRILLRIWRGELRGGLGSETHFVLWS